MKEIEITSKSGVLSATVFEAEASEAVLIFASATGVKQEFYKNFSSYLAEHGITVITFDYVGIGRSLKSPIRKLTNGAADWGKNDLEAVIEYAISTYPNSKKILLGHSIGGQLVGLCKSSLEMDKVILVASQSGYWKFWKGRDRVRMWFNWHVLFPTMLGLFGYLPSKKISGMEDLPKNVANQWRNWGKNENYLFHDETVGEVYYDKVNCDVTAFSIDDDELAPKESVDWMTSKFSSASVKPIHLVPQDFDTKKIGHFGLFKEKFRESVWKVFLEEIK